ncbi:MAG: hydroxymethylbilane synthase [Deltaproteobacteria bacterium]|nr:hydroxymethylbilane synthase [Deltaproteobacteria bacterium]
MRRLVIGTRGSALARWQAEHVAARVRSLPSRPEVELKIIRTQGDIILDVPLAQVGGKGLFVKEIEEALLRREVDLAVHSMKDVPAELPEGLGLTAIPEREDPRDAVIGAEGGLAALPQGACVGTSSLRRRCQLLALRPDLAVDNLRGNVDTRLRKVADGQYAAIILAAAGLTRLGYLDRVTEFLPLETWLPAVGQGALGIETRCEDAELNGWLAALHHEPSARCVRAERTMLAALEGGCQVPIAGYAEVMGERLKLRALVGHPEGSPVFHAEAEGPAADPEALGSRVAEELLGRGARAVLDEVYGRGVPSA